MKNRIWVYMAAGGPWEAAKYSHGVWEHFADQANPFLKKYVFVSLGSHYPKPSTHYPSLIV